ncbi:hypothetical protein [Herbidospora daliensis]|uniref:hypothetical protein n=1 Tax=Herbidospora daliensis TaxID=295585 RepID=UPI0012F9ACF8|nr:hypothetical protein [Herbidospora daliensis]
MSARMAGEQLIAELARRNVPSYLVELNRGLVAVCIWHGLIARADGVVIWWQAPGLSRRGHPLATYAHSVAGAAHRLSEQYVRARESHVVPPIYGDSRAFWGPLNMGGLPSDQR